MWLDGLLNCTSTGISIIAGILCWYFLKRPRNFPPGPHGLPLVGYFPFLGKNTAETLRQMKKKYGSVMSVQFGREDWVILNDYEAVNEALVNQSEKFSGRTSNFVFDMLTQGRGIVTADYGPEWKVLHKFGSKTLRGFGVGRKGMEANIIEEMPLLIESMRANDGKSLYMKFHFTMANIICRIVFGSRFEYEDKKFLHMLQMLQNLVSNNFNATMLKLVLLAPILRYIPPFKGIVENAIEENHTFKQYMREIIQQHKSNFNELDIRDLIDAFLNEMKTKNDDDASFNESNLIQFIIDLIGAGSGTTSATLHWAILAFAHFSECQEEIAKEIENILGEEGVPSMEHKDEMPYTCAFIQELMRHRTLSPLTVLHKTNEKAILNGYTIPKNTTIAPNIWAVHHDSRYFENPREFRPERFLDRDRKFIKSNHVIPFSIGSRHCLGEQLARMELFIFITGILQKLKVLPNPHKPLPSFHSGIDSLITYEAPDFDVVFERRK
ncbi:cytochrome P450 2U1-like [Styela clava]